jgi:hypothetical protein
MSGREKGEWGDKKYNIRTHTKRTINLILSSFMFFSAIITEFLDNKLNQGVI